MTLTETQTDLSPGCCKTGIAGLDALLQCGLPRNRLYVIEGEPGCGKTTLALQFLLEGVRNGERSLYITFSETKEELQAVASSHGWDISKIELVDLAALENQLLPQAQTSLFHPSEIELNQITENLLAKIEEVDPSRIAFDSVSEMRLLAETSLRYRRQILAFKQALTGRCATVFFLDDLTSASQDLQVQSIAHGVITLSRMNHDFGGERRRIRILKLRGVRFISGYHDFDITTGGLEVYPRMISSLYPKIKSEGRLESGAVELDSLLGGGLDRGTSNLFIGPAGTNKSTLCLLYALSATKQGEKVSFFCFDETVENLLKRSNAIGLRVEEAMSSGLLQIQKVDPAELSPGAFASVIQSRVTNGAKVVVIDSLNGYIQAMPQEHFLVLQLHELLAFLNNQGVVTLMTIAQQGTVGPMQSPVDLTYLADTVVLTRFFEARGAVKKAISIIKKRTGAHETTIRSFSVDENGLHVGPVLNEFQGILTGIPQIHSEASSAYSSQKEA